MPARCQRDANAMPTRCQRNADAVSNVGYECGGFPPSFCSCLVSTLRYPCFSRRFVFPPSFFSSSFLSGLFFSRLFFPASPPTPPFPPPLFFVASLFPASGVSAFFCFCFYFIFPPLLSPRPFSFPPVTNSPYAEISTVPVPGGM